MAHQTPRAGFGPAALRIAIGGVAAAALGLVAAGALAMSPADEGAAAAPQQLMWKADEIAAFEEETGGWPSGLHRRRLPG